MKRTCWICISLLALAAATTVHAEAFFVATGPGNDSNPGISAASPFRTIQRAIDEAGLRPGPDMIQVAAGEYLENLSISDADDLTLSGDGGVVVAAADPSQDVLTISAGDISISGLAIVGGDKGISAKGSESTPVSLSLRDSVVMDNAGDGLRATNVVNVSISHSTFLENGGTAIRAQTADDVTVSQCTLQDNSGRGMRVEDALSVVISHCLILDNNDDGVKVVTASLNPVDTSVSISDTTISGSDDDGIDLEDLGDVRLAQLTVYGSGDDGVAVDNTGSVSVVGGTYSDNSGDGLDMDDVQSIRLVSVASGGNSASGVQVTAEEDYDVEWLSVTGCDFMGNSLDGIRILEEATIVQGARLTSVTATDNGERGLNIVVTGAVKLTAVTSENNGTPDALP